jgi:hypothetical protein
MLQMKATSYLNAVLDQEGPAQTSWCSKWAVLARQAGVNTISKSIFEILVITVFLAGSAAMLSAVSKTAQHAGGKEDRTLCGVFQRCMCEVLLRHLF